MTRSVTPPSSNPPPNHGRLKDPVARAAAEAVAKAGK